MDESEIIDDALDGVIKKMHSSYKATQTLLKANLVSKRDKLPLIPKKQDISDRIELVYSKWIAIFLLVLIATTVFRKRIKRISTGIIGYFLKSAFQ